MKRLSALIAALAIALSSVAGPVAAQTEIIEACENPGPVNLLTGMLSDNQANRSGARATINLSNGYFRECFGGTSADEVSAWVAVQAPPGQCAAGDGNCIIQIGIFRDAETDTLHYAWADGGCGGDLPIAYGLGLANDAPHEYIIWLGADEVWNLQIDKTLKKRIDSNGSTVSCWSRVQDGQGVIGSYFLERWDAGSSIGNVDDRTWIYAAKYGRYNLGWSNVNWPEASPCSRRATDDACITDTSSTTNVVQGFKAYTSN